MKRIPDWFLALLWAATMGLFVVAAIPALVNPEPKVVLARFIAPTVLLAVCVFVSAIETLMSILATAHIETWVFLGSAAVTGVLFIAGMFPSDADTRDLLHKAAFSVGGFTVGLKVGCRLDQTNPSPMVSALDEPSKKISILKK